jgi:hypothetical protein
MALNLTAVEIKNMGRVSSNIVYSDVRSFVPKKYLQSFDFGVRGDVELQAKHISFTDPSDIAAIR